MMSADATPVALKANRSCGPPVVTKLKPAASVTLKSTFAPFCVNVTVP